MGLMKKVVRGNEMRGGRMVKGKMGEKDLGKMENNWWKVMV